MPTCPQHTNHTEDRLIAALDCGRSLAREADEWMRTREQMRFEEQNRLKRLLVAAFKKPEAAR